MKAICYIKFKNKLEVVQILKDVMPQAQVIRFKGIVDFVGSFKSIINDRKQPILFVRMKHDCPLEEEMFVFDADDFLKKNDETQKSIS